MVRSQRQTKIGFYGSGAARRAILVRKGLLAAPVEVSDVRKASWPGQMRYFRQKLPPGLAGRTIFAKKGLLSGPDGLFS